MKKNIGFIVIIVNLFLLFLITRIFNIPINMDSLFWIVVINFIAYIVEIYLLFRRKKRE
ncbi:hypothetical protein [Clostridium lacusfryxellense]|uniref:hypothetical protein n=1 Tax=Clostridium lacusfryxellense TaxID=205328 RepID=UPI001C0BE2EF|nr:hypothetical protein [Clostridium lacusfryxellense]MBU3114774.1 hypothetical protein [Clostridium lacusfryxellense]